MAADRQDENGIHLRDVTVQGEVAVGAAPDDQFALAASSRAANQGIEFQHVERRQDFPDARPGILDLISGDALSAMPFAYCTLYSLRQRH